MNPWIVRLIISLVFAAILAYQWRSTSGRPLTRRAYAMGAMAFLAFAALNFALGTGAEYGLIQTILGVLAVAALFYAVILLLQGVRAGEMRGSQESAAKMIEEFKKRGERDTDG